MPARSILLILFFSSEGYNCKLCHAELSNTYLHCLGCESLLSKDFNICLTCFREERYYLRYDMDRKNKSSRSDLHHTGQREKERNGRGCRCHQGICPDCKLCKTCSCRCHHRFQHRRRFFESTEIQSILDECEKISQQAGGMVSDCRENLESSVEQENESDAFGTVDMATTVSQPQPVSAEEVQDPPLRDDTLGSVCTQR